jgi:acyl carrier protein
VAGLDRRRGGGAGVTRAELEAGVRDLLAQVTHTPSAAIGPGFDCAQSAGWSSLQHLMLISQLEARFDVAFKNEEMPGLATYDAIASALASRLDPSP